MRALAIVLAVLSALFTLPTVVRIKSRRTLPLLAFNFLGTAWAPYLGITGSVAAVLGAWSDSMVATVLGGATFFVGMHSLFIMTRAHDEAFARGLGPRWREDIDPAVEARMVQGRWQRGLPPAAPASCRKDVVFATLRGTERRLRCDVWEPAGGVTRSGLAVVYLHGGAWYLIDKDVGTRRFFRHLASQGHVVVDVAYRLCPEADALGMAADARRAVAYVKAHADALGVRPDRVVLMGGSAGAHVALLAAFTARDAELTPEDLAGVDTRVAAVVSYYGVVDLPGYDAFARRFQPPGPLPEDAPRPAPSGWVRRLFTRLAGRTLPDDVIAGLPPHHVMMRQLTGARTPVAEPEDLRRASPMHHVGPHCPPTLVFQPRFDHLAPVESGRLFAGALAHAGVPHVYIELERTLHAYDLLLPPLIHPAAQGSLYDVERFLAWVNASAAREVPAPHTAALLSA